MLNIFSCLDFLKKNFELCPHFVIIINMFTELLDRALNFDIITKINLIYTIDDDVLHISHYLIFPVIRIVLHEFACDK